MSRYIILSLYIGASSCTYMMFYICRICAGEQRAAASCRFGCLNYHFGIASTRASKNIRIKVGFYSLVSFSLSSVCVYIYIFNIIIYLPAPKGHRLGWGPLCAAAATAAVARWERRDVRIYLHRPNGIYTRVTHLPMCIGTYIK